MNVWRFCFSSWTLSGHVTGGPELHDQGQHHQRQQRCDDVDQFGAAQHQQHQRLATAEHGAGDEGHHAGLAQAPQAVLQHHHHDRTQDGENLQHEHHVGGQGRQRHPALLGPVAHRNTNGPVGPRGDVAHQGQHRGPQWLKAQRHQQRCADGYRNAETGRPFQKTAKAVGDQQHLNALVSGDGRDGRTHDIEIAGPHTDAVEPHGHQHDPADGPESGQKTEHDGPDTHAHWHAENGDADTQRQHQCTEGGPDAAQFEDRQPQQEEEDGNGCDERRQHGRLQRVVDLLPHDDGDSL